MMQDNPRKITYGAMMIALFAILLAVVIVHTACWDCNNVLHPIADYSLRITV